MSVAKHKRFNTCRIEAYEYYNQCKGLLKLLNFKDSLRTLFQELGKNYTDTIPDNVTKDLAKAIDSLGSPFNLYTDIIESKDFKRWVLSLRAFLFDLDYPDSQKSIWNILNTIDFARNMLGVSLFPILIPSKSRMNLFIDSALLMEEIKRYFKVETPTKEVYQSNVIDKVDEFFEPLDRALLTNIFFLLKISVTDYFKFVEKQNLGIDTILEKYKYNEILLRKIRNVLAHPPRSYKKDYGIWKNLFDNLRSGNKNKGIKPVKDFSKVIDSDVGNIIFNGNYTSFTNKQMKDTLNYECMKRIVDFIGTWLEKLTQEILNYF